jgi:hypothetical protein
VFRGMLPAMVEREKLDQAVRELGWRWDAPTAGYRKGKMWTSLLQAEAAFAGAQSGETVVPDQGLSETFAGIIVAAGHGDSERG